MTLLLLANFLLSAAPMGRGGGEPPPLPVVAAAQQCSRRYGFRPYPADQMLAYRLGYSKWMIVVPFSLKLRRHETRMYIDMKTGKCYLRRQQ